MNSNIIQHVIALKKHNEDGWERVQSSFDIHVVKKVYISGYIPLYIRIL